MIAPMRRVVNEPETMRFEVHRSALVDPAVHELEQRRIFERSCEKCGRPAGAIALNGVRP